MRKNVEDKKIYITPEIEIIPIVMGVDVMRNSFETGGEMEGGHNNYSIDVFE